MPHPSSRILHITLVPGYQMAVEVEHGLPGEFAAVHTDVVPVGYVFRFYEPLCHIDRLAQVYLLLVRQLEIVPSNLVGNDEHVPWRDGEGVLDDEEVLVPVQHSVLRYLGEVSHLKTPI